MVRVSVVSLVVREMLAPAAKVRVSELPSATMSSCPDTAMVEKRSWAEPPIWAST